MNLGLICGLFVSVCLQVVKSLIETSRVNSWAELVHCKLICILTNMFYQVPDESNTAIMSTTSFLVDQVDLIGGIDFIFIEVRQLV